MYGVKDTRVNESDLLWQGKDEDKRINSDVVSAQPNVLEKSEHGTADEVG